jgi:hypothetical protein
MRQIEANRRNATLSTGPRSEEGKAVSSRNAVTHSMTARQVGFESDREKVDERLERWRAELRPVGTLQEWMAGRVVTDGVRVERCEAEEDALRQRRAARADSTEVWGGDRRAEVEALAEGLARRPAVVAAKLAQTLHGCDWMLARWRLLKETVGGSEGGAAARPLDEEQRGLAFDLLGLRPEQRQGRTALDPDPPAGGAAEPGPNPGEVAAHQAMLIAGEIDRLEGLQDAALREEDEISREHARGGVGPVDAELRLVNRYRAMAMREMRLAWAELKRMQDEAAKAAKVPPHVDVLGIGAAGRERERRDRERLQVTEAAPREVPGDACEERGAALAATAATPCPGPEAAAGAGSTSRPVPPAVPAIAAPVIETILSSLRATMPVADPDADPVLLPPHPGRRARHERRAAKSAHRGLAR